MGPVGCPNAVTPANMAWIVRQAWKKSRPKDVRNCRLSGLCK